MKSKHGYEMGQVIEVYEDEMEPRRKVFVKDSHDEGVLCVSSASENSFYGGGEFSVTFWGKHRPIPPKVKRLKTAQELVGMWIRFKGMFPGQVGFASAINGDGKLLIGREYLSVHPGMEYAPFPGSEEWKGVEVEE